MSWRISRKPSVTWDAISAPVEENQPPLSAMPCASSCLSQTRAENLTLAGTALSACDQMLTSCQNPRQQAALDALITLERHELSTCGLLRYIIVRRLPRPWFLNQT